MRIIKGEPIQSSNIYEFLETENIYFCSVLIEILPFLIGPAQTLILLEDLSDSHPEIPFLIPAPLGSLTSVKSYSSRYDIFRPL